MIHASIASAAILMHWIVCVPVCKAKAVTRKFSKSATEKSTAQSRSRFFLKYISKFQTHTFLRKQFEIKMIMELRKISMVTGRNVGYKFGCTATHSLSRVSFS
jgi:hypothetical protein